MATYALIPGAGGDAWEWHLVARELEAGATRGPGLASDGRRRRRLERVRRRGRRGDRRSTDVVLVAQSLAGFTAPLVCERPRSSSSSSSTR